MDEEAGKARSEEKPFALNLQGFNTSVLSGPQQMRAAVSELKGHFSRFKVSPRGASAQPEPLWGLGRQQAASSLSQAFL